MLIKVIYNSFFERYAGSVNANRFNAHSHEAADRRYFIGGSDARIIMGDDEAALIRLWKEKRGEVEPEDLSGNLIVQLGVRHRRPKSALV